jgi:hypothetical protein
VGRISKDMQSLDRQIPDLLTMFISQFFGILTAFIGFY